MHFPRTAKKAGKKFAESYLPIPVSTSRLLNLKFNLDFQKKKVREEISSQQVEVIHYIQSGFFHRYFFFTVCP